MITDKEIEKWFSTISISDFDGIQAKHVYEMAEIAYKKGIEDAASKCEQRAESLPYNQQAIARQCKKDVISLIPKAKGD